MWEASKGAISSSGRGTEGSTEQETEARPEGEQRFRGRPCRGGVGREKGASGRGNGTCLWNENGGPSWSCRQITIAGRGVKKGRCGES